MEVLYFIPNPEVTVFLSCVRCLVAGRPKFVAGRLLGVCACVVCVNVVCVGVVARYDVGGFLVEWYRCLGVKEVAFTRFRGSELIGSFGVGSITTALACRGLVFCSGYVRCFFQ